MSILWVTHASTLICNMIEWYAVKYGKILKISTRVFGNVSMDLFEGLIFGRGS